MKGISSGYSTHFTARLRTVLLAYMKKGKIAETLFYSILFPLINLFMRFLFSIDPLFYPSISDTAVDRPLIILGHYRSGTTYLQKLIAESGTVSYSTLRTLLFPSLTMMKIFTPLASVFSRLSFIDSEKKGHKMSLYEIEEDEGLFLHSLNTEMLTVFCPWMLTEDETVRKGIEAGWNDMRDEDIDILFLREYIKRQLVSQGKNRSLIKTNPSVFRIRQLLKHFPDARFIYIYRDPVEAIPSFFSLHYNFIRKRLNRDEAVKYFNNKYKFSLSLYNYFENIKDRIPSDQLLTINFNDLKLKPDETVQNVFRFADLELTDNYIGYLNKKRKEKHRRKHQNTDFSFAGFTPERIRKDFSIIRKLYS